MGIHVCSSNLHLGRVGSLVSHNNSRQGRRVANVPYEWRISMSPLLDELGIHSQNWTSEPSPPDAVGMKSGLAAQLAGFRKSNEMSLEQLMEISGTCLHNSR